MSEVKAINESKGLCWFSPSNMRFFRTKIVSRELIKDKYFVTSEQFVYEGIAKPRLYSVREFNPESGDIHSVGLFQQFHSYKQAREYAESLP